MGNVRERLIDYVNRELEVHATEDGFIFETGKRRITPKSVEVFHHIAQALELTKLKRGHAAPWFHMNVPNGFKEGTDLEWNVALHQSQNSEYEERYADQYTLEEKTW